MRLARFVVALLMHENGECYTQNGHVKRNRV